jgi:hypothetical protein
LVSLIQRPEREISFSRCDVIGIPMVCVIGGQDGDSGLIEGEICTAGRILLLETKAPYQLEVKLVFYRGSNAYCEPTVSGSKRYRILAL